MNDNIDNNPITPDDVFEKFISQFPTVKHTYKQILNQNNIKQFQKIWSKEFISYRGRYKKKHIDTKKNKNTRIVYLLFIVIIGMKLTVFKSIWKTSDTKSGNH